MLASASAGPVLLECHQSGVLALGLVAAIVVLKFLEFLAGQN